MPNNKSKIKKPRTIQRSVFDKMLTSSYKNIADKANLVLKAKNIRHSGTLIEDFVKNIFTQMFGSRFRVTSGYIINSGEKGEDFKISPEIDLIVLDTLVPNILFPQSEFTNRTEFIPIEAVVGIFEIKKTLNEKVIKEALQHITEIKQSVGIRKDNDEHYRLGGMPTDIIQRAVGVDTRYREPEIIHEPRKIRTDIFSNPITGIIGLENKIKADNIPYDPNNFVDLIFSFDGFLQIIVQKNTSYFHTLPIINPYNYNYRHITKSPQNIKIAFGCLSDYLYKTSGRCFNPMKYYRNTHLNI